MTTHEEEVPTGKNHYGAVERGTELRFRLDQLKIVTDPSHPLWDSAADRPFDEENVRSILEHGQITPVSIWMDGPERVVADGRGRMADMMEANRRLKEFGKPELLMRAVMISKTDVLTTMKRSMVANTHRYTKSPLQQASQIQHMMKFQLSEEEIAGACRCSIDTVKNNVKLLACSPAVKAAVEAGQLSVTAARQFHDLSITEQNALLPTVIDLAGSDQSREIEAGKRRAKELRRAKLPTADLSTPPPKGPEKAAATRAAAASGKPVKVKPQRVPKDKEPKQTEMRLYRDIIGLRREISESESTIETLGRAYLDWVLGDNHALDDYPVIVAALKKIGAGRKSKDANGAGTSSGGVVDVTPTPATATVTP